MNNHTSPINDLQEIVRKIPKTDLHVHLDGSVRLGTIAEIAKQEQIKLPSYTVEGLNELVFKEKYQNLEEYLEAIPIGRASWSTTQNEPSRHHSCRKQPPCYTEDRCK